MVSSHLSTCFANILWSLPAVIQSGLPAVDFGYIFPVSSSFQFHQFQERIEEKIGIAFFVLHQSAFLTPLVVSTLLRFGFRLFEKRKRGHSAGWERSYSLPFHRISNLFKTLGSSSMTGPGSADFYSRTKPSWLFIFLQVMTCGCQCGSSFSAGPGPPVMNGIFKVCHGTEPPFLRILPA